MSVVQAARRRESRSPAPGRGVPVILTGVEVSLGGPPCDIRPFRGNPCVPYAGCMTVTPTAPINRVYTSHAQPSTGSIAPAQTCEFQGNLAFLVAGSRPRTWKHPKPRRPRMPDWPCGSLVKKRPRFPKSGAVGILVARVPPRLVQTYNAAHQGAQGGGR